MVSVCDSVGDIRRLFTAVILHVWAHDFGVVGGVINVDALVALINVLGVVINRLSAVVSIMLLLVETDLLVAAAVLLSVAVTSPVAFFERKSVTSFLKVVSTGTLG